MEQIVFLLLYFHTPLEFSKWKPKMQLFAEEILAWKMITLHFHVQIQGCTYLFFIRLNLDSPCHGLGGLKWLWVGTIPILALVAGFQALCPGAEMVVKPTYTDFSREKLI